MNFMIQSWKDSNKSSFEFRVLGTRRVIFSDWNVVKEILMDFSMPELGIYAMLPSNRQIPHRVRVLMDYLVSNLGVSV